MKRILIGGSVLLFVMGLMMISGCYSNRYQMNESFQASPSGAVSYEKKVDASGGGYSGSGGLLGCGVYSGGYYRPYYRPYRPYYYGGGWRGRGRCWR